MIYKIDEINKLYNIYKLNIINKIYASNHINAICLTCITFCAVIVQPIRSQLSY